MKRAILPVLALAGIVTLGIVLPRGTSKDLSLGQWRLAVARVDCLQDAGVTLDQVRTVCKAWERHGNYLACVTDREADNPHPCEIENPLSLVPDSAFRRAVVCEHPDAEHPEVTVRAVYYPDLDQTIPPGWTCEVILPKVLWRKSYCPVKSRLLEALQSKCCADCLDSCWVQEGSWKACPYCLLDANCSDYCPEPETP